MNKPQQKNGIEINECTDGYVIYDADNDKAHFLNATAVLILELCNGSHDETEIADIIGRSFTLPEPPLTEVKSIIENFYHEGLLLSNEK